MATLLLLLFRGYHENQNNRTFHDPSEPNSPLKTSGYSHGTCSSFLLPWLDPSLVEASCAVNTSGIIRSQTQPLNFFVLWVFFLLNTMSAHNFIFIIQLKKKRSNSMQKCSIAHLSGYSNFQCCQWKESFPTPPECRMTQQKLSFPKNFNQSQYDSKRNSAVSWRTETSGIFAQLG